MKADLGLRFAGYRSSLWAPVVFWITAAMTLSALATEHILQPLRPNPVALNIARLSAYTSIALLTVTVVAVVLMWAVAARLTLGWFKVSSSYRDVVVTSFGALWVLGAYAAVSALFFILFHPAPLTLRGVGSWSRYIAFSMRQQPIRFIVQGQLPLILLALSTMCWVLRRRLRCTWGDAALTVGVAAVMVAVAFYSVTFAARVIGKL